MIVYKITNIKNEKVYIGQTIQSPKIRWQHHYCNSKSGRSYIKSSILKEGKENFIFEVIDMASSIEELNQKEIYWISFYDSMNCGYNLTPGGKNYRRSEETKRKTSEKLKGRKQTREAIEKTRNHHLGSKRSIESKKRMSEIAKSTGRGKHLVLTIKKTKVIDHNGIIYESISDAAKKTNCSRDSIYKVLNGEFKQVNGYIFYRVNG